MQPVNDEEINMTLKSLENNKASGVDGYKVIFLTALGIEEGYQRSLFEEEDLSRCKLHCSGCDSKIKDCSNNEGDVSHVMLYDII